MSLLFLASWVKSAQIAAWMLICLPNSHRYRSIHQRLFLSPIADRIFCVIPHSTLSDICCLGGFLFASYAAVANDSIQTIGTFIASNKGRPWWVLWIFIAGIFVFTMTYSWLSYDGDVTYARLASKGFESAPTSFSPLQVSLPLILILLTRFKMPVSTTFLLLTSFSTKATAVGKV